MAYFGTVTPLGTKTDLVSDPLVTRTFDTIRGTVFSDTAGTLFIDQGFRADDGKVYFDAVSSYPVTAGTGTRFREDIVAPLWRVRFHQTGNQKALRIFAQTGAAGYSGG
jgi:hypothetical protein